MNWLSGFIRRQGQLILSNDIYALFNVVMLVVFSYTGWLAASVIALVTLRKGLKTGGLLLVAACFTNFFMLKTAMTVNEAAIGSFFAFVPCYLAAGALCLTNSWRLVAGVLLLQVFLTMCLLHALLPEFIVQQYLTLREILTQLQVDNAFLKLDKSIDSAVQILLANYLVGVQAAGVVLASLGSLAIARYVQSKLYYPEGFKLEVRALRANKADLLLLIMPILAAKQHHLLAIDILPVILLFFCIAGLSLWFNFMAMKGLFLPMMLLSVVLGFFPYVMLPVCVLFGSLDTLFNFRVLLQNKVSKTIGEVK